jgi:creatinine amidohydrolase
MSRFILSLALSSLLVSASGEAQTNAVPAELPVKLEELSSPKFVQALEKSGHTCVIAFGIIEKHGPHLPVGTDLMQVREMCLRAARREYTIVFPDYYFGQINEARHQPGTIAYSHDLIWNLLQETCDELARNGVRKIILVNGHGGNNDFVKYFSMSQLERHHPYTLYLVDPWGSPAVNEAVQAKTKSTQPGGHADETETSMIMALHPELVHLEEGKAESGADQKRLSHLTHTSTGIAWYAGYPNHYSGQGFNGSVELGEFQFQEYAKWIAAAIQEVKADTTAPALQEKFYRDALNPGGKK